eukprot:TRINITY_DN104_c0_g1_i1.p1 TRINITY_DN104_c0_g1~~TRINITY_DN104_c0_g1_i1.p1  ORF type:complete len:558 (-),score=49.25 TRINITY_DN104_c0_g1_i1:6073-7746(-)
MVNDTPICEKCYNRCLTCNGPSPEDCLSCRPEFIVVDIKNGSNVKCLSCADIGPGLYFSEGTCKEICGDGINSGQYECDDGNLFNGDGCSADCKIEYGYKCKKNVDRPDTCFDILPPEVTAKNDKRNNIVLKFSETVKTPYNTEELSERIHVQLEGVPEDCTFVYNVQPTLKEFTKMNITTQIGCSVKGNVERFVVTIHPNASIKDFGGNDLANNVLEVKVYRRLHISQGEKQAAEGCGSAFASTSLLTFAFSCGIILFQYFFYYTKNRSVAVTSFWSFINMLQIISYLPSINCNIPPNLEILLTEYLTMKKLVFPFSSLPNFIPNPLFWVNYFVNVPLTDKLKVLGYASVHFLYNFAEELLTWILLALIYLILSFLVCICPESTCGYFHKWKKEYEYNTICRVLMEAFLNMSFCALLNIWWNVLYYLAIIMKQHDLEGLPNKISLITASICAVFYINQLRQYLAIGFMIKVAWLTEMKNSVVAGEEFKEKYGTLIEGIKVGKSFSGRMFTFIFLYRRLLYALVLVIAQEYPLFQLIFSVFFLFLPVFLLLWHFHRC